MIVLGLLSVAVGLAAAESGSGPAVAAKKCKKKATPGAKKKKKKCLRPKTKAPGTPPSSPPPRQTTGPPPVVGTDPGSDVVDTGTGCGTEITKSDGSPWQCTFSDNFDGTGLDRSKWLPITTADTGFVSGPTACFVDTPNNISISNGTLKLTARKESAPFSCAGAFTTPYTSGYVSTLRRFSQTYGRFEIRARVPSAQVKGLQTSLWLYPEALKYGPWPASGEIDIAEMFSQYSDRAIPYVHYNPLLLADPLATNNLCFITNLDAFHTYAVEWTASTISFYYDGRLCLTDPWVPALPLQKPAPFDQPFNVNLTQGLGVGGNSFDPNSTPLPATTEVDYVRAWK